jgi:hypothetical protein
VVGGSLKEGAMLKIGKTRIAAILFASGLLGCHAAAATVRIEGHVDAGGGPVAKSTVTLWAGGMREPRQLAQTKTGDDGRFQLHAAETAGKDVVLYLVAKGGEPTINKGAGDNPAIAFLTVLGAKPPTKVTINEMTTVASVWTRRREDDSLVIR